jgi:hypothetical protein
MSTTSSLPSRRLRIVLAAALFVAGTASGVFIGMGVHSSPLIPAAGPGSCAQQVTVAYATDDEMRAAMSVLAQHKDAKQRKDVAAVVGKTKQEMAEWFKAWSTELKQPEVGELMSRGASATVFVLPDYRTTAIDLGMALRYELQGKVAHIDVDNPYVAGARITAVRPNPPLTDPPTIYPT